MYEKIVPKPVEKIKIDVELIPDYQRQQLAELALAVTQQLFSRPGEEERYQRWLQERQQRETKERINLKPPRKEKAHRRL